MKSALVPSLADTSIPAETSQAVGKEMTMTVCQRV
jgi:hypothetical protein